MTIQSSKAYGFKPTLLSCSFCEKQPRQAKVGDHAAVQKWYEAHDPAHSPSCLEKAQAEWPTLHDVGRGGRR